MTEPKRVLVVVDPTASAHPSIARAAWLAQHASVHLELFISDYAEVAIDARTAALERHRLRLETLAQPLRAAGHTVELDARWAQPLHDSILRKAVDSRADLVVKDTHAHSALQRSILSNTDWSLIRECAATLWLVKPRPPGEPPCFVAAVDPLHERDKPADLDRRILATALALGAAFGGEVHAFHAYDVSAALAASTDSMAMPMTLPPVNDLTDAIRAAHTDAVERLCRAHGIPPERTHVQQGGTRQLLMGLTERLRADAVVMGAASRSGLTGFLLGNTAEDVLDRLHCDLVIVKPAGFGATFAS
jgi:universal stress protein E